MSFFFSTRVRVCIPPKTRRAYNILTSHLAMSLITTTVTSSIQGFPGARAFLLQEAEVSLGRLYDEDLNIVIWEPQLFDDDILEPCGPGPMVQRNQEVGISKIFAILQQAKCKVQPRLSRCLSMDTSHL